MSVIYTSVMHNKDIPILDLTWQALLRKICELKVSIHRQKPKDFQIVPEIMVSFMSQPTKEGESFDKNHIFQTPRSRVSSS